ncbi:MAG: mannose-1-phosphate guanylyltransferase [Candidatus Promineifilaceae bacterium]
MHIVIFAGGSGRRLWPISRKALPKQFEPIIGEQSTIQLAAERLAAAYGPERLFVSTNSAYLPILRRQLPQLPESHFIGEPARRDLAAAVGLAMFHLLARFGRNEPVAILWGDNYMQQGQTFLRILVAAEEIIQQGEAKMVFIGETARFANNNLGWIGLGERLGELCETPYYAFKSWIYRPELAECRRMFAAGGYVWNTGYFVTTPGYVLDAYRTYQPELWAGLEEIGRAIGAREYEERLSRLYPQLLEAHFDDAIAKCLPVGEAVVIHDDMGWSDPGTLYALKEALQANSEENVVRGLVAARDVRDSLLYNYEDGKLMAAVGLDGMVVVNTPDALVVVHKDNIHLVKELVDGLAGTDLEKFS